MEIGLKPEAEEQAQHVEKAADRILKGAALIGLAGVILARGVEAAHGMELPLSAGMFIVSVLAGCFLVAAAGPMVTFGVAAYDPTKNMQDWKPVAQKVFGLVFAGVFALLLAGLFYGDQRNAGVAANAAVATNP